jgi:hypothetical protein
MRQHIVVWSRVGLAAAFVVSIMLSTPTARADDDGQIRRGFEIIGEIFPKSARLNLVGKNWALVGLGSYLVNSTGCNDCHTHPNWAPGGNPYVVGQPQQINTAEYLAGGRVFGPIASPIAISPNITPDRNGRPAGLTLAGFLEVMRTGHDPRDPPGDLLQVMPWPLYRWKTDQDLIAMYEYLRTIPTLPDNPQPGP